MTSFQNRIALSCLSLAGAAALVSIAEPAGARSAPTSVEDVRRVSVPYADLDLSNMAGQATFDRRVTVAARSVCAEPSRMSRIQSQKELSCQREALAQAYQNVGLNHELPIDSAAIASPAP